MSAVRGNVGCLFIGDDLNDAQEGWALEIPGVAAQAFRHKDARAPWDALQAALQAVRTRWGACNVMARGTGCAAALALACQLPVEKLVLIDPAVPARYGGHDESPDARRMRRATGRLAAFARRNLALCVSDVLVVEHGPGDGGSALRRAFGKPVNCRVQRLCVQGESAKELYTIREFEVKAAISRFLHPSDGPKPLAENSEMCIIYG